LIYLDASKFDFINYNGEPVKANGYRSLLNVLKSLLTHLMDHLHKYARERNKKFSNIAESLSNIVSYVRALQGLEKICRIVIALMTISDPPVLYNTREMKNCICLLLCSESINRDVYYGRCLGFQYSQGLKPILQFLAIAMASYEEWYKGSKEDPVKQLFSSLLNGGKYIQHPTQRGVKIADLTEDCSIDFTKAFWSITEQTAITTVAKFVSLNVDVSECIEVPAKDISVLSSLTGESVQIRPPFSDLGYKPVPLTLISFKHRDGQKSSRYGHRTTLPPSYALVIHFHGGGFVAQSSKSHEFYLRFWSRDLDCPILSVDYSLAPDGCYPRNLDECVFAYAWALNNFSILGNVFGSAFVFLYLLQGRLVRK
jgi:hormone-sensitive lipase